MARLAGLELDPWEEWVLRQALRERRDGKWAAFEVGIVVPRQNGKGAILEARELAGLFLLDERLLVHSAHQFDTSLEAFRRLLQLIEDTPELDRRVQRVVRSHGEEGIELKKNRRTGLRQRIRFRTRTKGGGRGFTGDLLVLDEAMILPESAHGALLPTLSARPNPQVFYTASAVDQQVHDDGVVLARLRQRGLNGDDSSLMYVEWSADVETRLRARSEQFDPMELGPDDVDSVFARDTRAWAQANPGLGIRISAEHVAREQRSMDPRTFAVERLNVGDWPRVDVLGDRVIPADVWMGLRDRRSRALNPVCFAFDLRRDRSAGAIAAAGGRRDGLDHVEVIDHDRGVGWMVPRIEELAKRHSPVSVVCGANSPAVSLVPALKRLGVQVKVASVSEHAQACGMLIDAVHGREIRHLGTLELEDALAGARTRAAGEQWVWSRKASPTDISPLVAVTLALWGWRSRPQAGVLRAEDYRIVAL